MLSSSILKWRFDLDINLENPTLFIKNYKYSGQHHTITAEATACDKCLGLAGVYITATPFPIHFPANEFRKSVEDDPSLLASATQKRNLNEAHGFWCHLGLALTMTAI